jgi:RNA polymerase sigma-70 factor (ECF subfamily)
VNVGIEERALIIRAAAGDRDALEAVLERFGPSVEEKLQVGSRWRRVLEPADVMQVTYLEAFLRIPSFDAERAESFPAWLKRIAENNLRDAIRALESQKHPPEAQRIEAQLGGDSYVGLFDLLSATGGTPSAAARNDEARELLDAALERLPDDYAKAVRLYDLEGRSIGEVATALGRSAGAVHMLRMRALDRLRELLGPVSRILDSEA